MADKGLQNMDDASRQATEQAARPVKDEAGKLAKRGARKAGRAVGRGARKLGRAAARGVKTVAKAAVKTAVSAVKALVSMIAKLIAILGPWALVLLAFILLFVLVWNVMYEERGSTESNDMTPGVENPSVVDPDTALNTAVAMTEPQAVIDAYYKYMSTQSFTKEYGDKLYEFADPDEVTDFSALRDYYDKENNFYLSDDFIRMMDETLHQGSFYFPEQVIKPVYGERLDLVNKKGEPVSAYTALLPVDFATGEKSRMFQDNFEEGEEVVKGFDQMLEDRSQLDHTDIPTANDEVPSLIAKSQTPEEHVSTEEGDAGTTYYSLSERNVVDGSGAAGTELGLWDYGFGSVLQYQPHQKIQYITCSYTSVDVDVHVRTRFWIDGDEYTPGHWSMWSGWSHDSVYTQSLDGITGKAGLDAAITEHLDAMAARNSSDTVQYDYTYDLPANIDAILSDTTTWDSSREPNAANEAALGRGFSNSHIDMKVEGAKDIEISRLEFSDELEAFANHGAALYPLNIALISHAATFSGNINYTITPAGTKGCNESRTPLQANSTATGDHREPVKKIKVAGGCGEVALTATRDGEVITQTPKVEETDSPWGFEYMQSFAEEYTSYVPSDYMNDRDFFLRTGLKAVESQTNGTAGEEEAKAAQQYSDNLKFLVQLDLLHPYAGDSLTSMGNVDIADLQDPESDLYILSRVIAAEAAHDKLDQLLVGAVFYNRVKSDRYPDTFYEVLSQPGQYACFTDGGYDSPSRQPTEEVIASAMQVMSGQFALPANILGQSQSVQGGIFMTNGVHYYCYGNDSGPAAYDPWGRPAMSPDQLKALAKELEGVDPNEISGTGAQFDPSSSVFIGDSLTCGLDSTKHLAGDGALVIAEVSAGLDRIRELVEESDASEWAGKDTVYLLAGTNSSTMYPDQFKEKYNALIAAINEKAQTGITIVLTSLPPVVDNKGHSTGNRWIDSSNQSIQEIASANGFPVLDIWSKLQKNGSLDPSYDSGDGLHLNSAGYTVWYSMIRGGMTSGSIGVPDSSGGVGGRYDIESDYKLYEIDSFDVLSAINMQAHLAKEDETAWNWLESLGGWFVDKGEDFLDLIGGFFEAMDELLFPSPNDNLGKCFAVGAPYDVGDIESIVYSTITFTSQVSFSTAADAADEQMANGNITFLFVGKDATLGLGTGGLGGGMQMRPGTGTTIEGLISPTKAYYTPLGGGFNGTYIELAVPEGTNILSVGAGEVVEVSNDESTASAKGKYVVQSVPLPDGRMMEVTYGFLEKVKVSSDSSLEAGDLIGVSGRNQDGTPSLYLRVVIDGETVDPMSIFYQPTLVYGSGSLGQDLNRPDGSINMEALAALQEELNALVGLEPGSGYSPSSFDTANAKMPYLIPPMNGLQPLQCTWWARARGLQYVMTFHPGRMTYTQYNSSNRGNGGEVYGNAKAAGIFATGTVPKPNSLVSFSSGSPYGHVAYVEAVDYVNRKYYISEAGSGSYWGGIKECNFGAPGETARGNYRLIGFVYLDEILI
ncbi:GDSL-type esterase/lipase family protein [uncultured Flavonifractor sp.]|uniref:GDSL-type esterase/lipase family protein n=1 Tax=uncultured Flavonifractor sp. TaxID=1193534 RepID=UPI0025983131|nr:GDSL-type esterase/lipase family protein [uncultured Flavonifractor sp.]